MIIKMQILNSNDSIEFTENEWNILDREIDIDKELENLYPNWKKEGCRISGQELTDVFLSIQYLEIIPSPVISTNPYNLPDYPAPTEFKVKLQEKIYKLRGFVKSTAPIHISIK